MRFAAFLLLAAAALAQTTPAKPASSATRKSGTQATTPKTGTHGTATGTKSPTPAKPLSKNPFAVFDTTAGKLTCELFKDKVPNAVDNFIGLATGKKDWTDPQTGTPKHGVPLYDGTIFHRVIPAFMIQGGDPLGTGIGNPGYKIDDEFSRDLKFDKPGTLAYANSGPNTNGSQFFITEGVTDFLDPCMDDAGCDRHGHQVPKGYGYTIFGQCTPESAELVKKIAATQCYVADENGMQRSPAMPCNSQASHPVTPPKINHIAVTTAAVALRKPAPSGTKNGTATKSGTTTHKAAPTTTKK